MRIALDPGNGVGGVILESLFQRFGAATEIINGEPDGSFPNRPSEPSPKNIGALMELVAGGDFDCGIAFDGDCDRCVFVDDRGRAVQTEKIGILLARELLKLRRGPVIAARYPVVVLLGQLLLALLVEAWRGRPSAMTEAAPLKPQPAAA